MYSYINKLTTFLIVFLSLACCNKAETQVDKNFWKNWGDSRAEINSYRLDMPRYGEHRTASAVLVFVTEDLGKQSQVKVDRVGPEKVKVLKLNHSRRFVTGIYDYAMMLSVFSPLEVWSFGNEEYPAVTPVKISLSSTEWCGNYYQQLNTRDKGYQIETHSYFDGEADANTKLTVGPELITEDDLFIRVREILAPFPAGEYEMLSSALFSRFSHESLKKVNSRIIRNKLNAKLKTEIGTFSVIQYKVETSQREYLIWVENSGERRILKWQIKFLSGEKGLVENAEILASFRTQYWSQNSVDHENLRAKLKLPTQSIVQ